MLSLFLLAVFCSNPVQSVGNCVPDGTGLNKKTNTDTTCDCGSSAECLLDTTGCDAAAVSGKGLCICPPGYFGNAIDCKTCSPGYKCAGGSVSVNDGQTICLKGTVDYRVFEWIKGNNNCHDCTAGQYQDQDGQSFFRTARNDYSDGDGPCKVCPAGRYGTNTKQIDITACIKCPAGYSNQHNQNGNSACDKCIAGYERSVDETGALLCKNCTVGRYGDMQPEKCNDCPTGFFQDEIGIARDCKMCTSGLTRTKKV